jgi:Leucine-rich repeat (LRR) protein
MAFSRATLFLHLIFISIVYTQRMKITYLLLSVLLIGAISFAVLSLLKADENNEAPGIDTDNEAVLDVDQVTTVTEENLNLSGRGLSEVPSDVFKKIALTSLDLSNNNLQGALPAQIRMLQNLRVLDLSDNDFTGVPAEIGQLQNLEVLDLSNNSITGLPYELGGLKNLKVLDLRGTQYAPEDLEIIKQGLRADVEIRTH